MKFLRGSSWLLFSNFKILINSNPFLQVGKQCSFEEVLHEKLLEVIFFKKKFGKTNLELWEEFKFFINLQILSCTAVEIEILSQLVDMKISMTVRNVWWTQCERGTCNARHSLVDAGSWGT